jgi:hypothetical protein
LAQRAGWEKNLFQPQHTELETAAALFVTESLTDSLFRSGHLQRLETLRNNVIHGPILSSHFVCCSIWFRGNVGAYKKAKDGTKLYQKMDTHARVQLVSTYSTHFE